MGTDRNPARYQEGDGFCHEGAAFELDHFGTGLHQGDGAGKGLFLVLLIAAEGQVGQHQRIAGTACHAARVVNHVLQGDGQRAAGALHHHAERIAHQQHVHAALVHQAGKAGVVAGQHGNLAAFRLHLLQGGDRMFHEPLSLPVWRDDCNRARIVVPQAGVCADGAEDIRAGGASGGFATTCRRRPAPAVRRSGACPAAAARTATARSGRTGWT